MRISLLFGLLMAMAGGVTAQTVTTIQEVIDANGNVVTLDMGTNRFQVLHYSTSEMWVWDGEKGYDFYTGSGGEWDSVLNGSVPGQYINGSWDVKWDSYPDIEPLPDNMNISKGDVGELVPVSCTGDEAAALISGHYFSYVSMKGTYDAATTKFTADDGTEFIVAHYLENFEIPTQSGEGTIKGMLYTNMGNNCIEPLVNDCFTKETATVDVLSAFLGLSHGDVVTVDLPEDAVQYLTNSSEYIYLWDGITGTRFFGLSLPGVQVGSYVNGTLTGQFESDYYDMYNSGSTVTVGTVAPLKAKTITGSEALKADKSNLFAYVSIHGTYTGYSLVADDGTEFTVQDYLGKAAAPAGNGTGTLTALYLGNTNSGSKDVGGNNLLQPIEADCFVPDGDTPGPGSDDNVGESLAWVKTRPNGSNLTLKMQENTVQFVYANDEAVVLWDGTDGLMVWDYKKNKDVDPFAGAQPGQFVSGTLNFDYSANNLYHASMGYDKNIAEITLGDVAELVPVERTVAELVAMNQEYSRDWDYITIKDAIIEDAAIWQGNDQVAFSDFFGTGYTLDEYEGKLVNLKGLFGAAWGAQFYPVSSDFIEVTGDAPVREYVFDANDHDIDIPSKANVNVTINNLNLKAGRKDFISLPIDLTAEQMATIFGNGTKLYSMTEVTETEDKTEATFKFDEATELTHYMPYIIQPANDVTTITVEGTPLYDYGTSEVGFINEDWQDSYSFKSTTRAYSYLDMHANYTWIYYFILDENGEALRVTEDRQAQAFSAYWQLNQSHFGDVVPQIVLQFPDDNQNETGTLADFIAQENDTKRIDLKENTVQFLYSNDGYTYLWDGQVGIRFYEMDIPGATFGSYINGTLAGTYSDMWNEYSDAGCSLTVGEVADVVAKSITGEEMVAETGENLLAYVSLHGQVKASGFSFLTDDGITVNVYPEVSGKGTGTITALYYGNRGRAVGGEDHLLIPLTDNAFVSDGDTPDDEPHSLAWVKEQPQGETTLIMEKNKVQVAYADDYQTILWDGTDGIYLDWYDDSKSNVFADAEMGQYINGSFTFTRFSSSMITGEVADGSKVNIELAAEAELTPITTTLAALKELTIDMSDFSRCWDYVTVKNVSVENGKLLEGDVELSCLDYLGAGFNIKDYEGKTGTVTGMFVNNGWIIPIGEDFFVPNTEEELPVGTLSAFNDLEDEESAKIQFEENTVQLLAVDTNNNYTYLWDGEVGVRFYDLGLTGGAFGAYINGKLGGTYYETWNDIEEYTVNELTVGETAAVTAKAMTGAELTQADRKNMYAYASVHGTYQKGKYNGTFTTDDGTVFTVEDYLGLQAIPTTSGKGTLKALYLGNTDRSGGAQIGDVSAEQPNVLQPLEADAFTADPVDPSSIDSLTVGLNGSEDVYSLDGRKQNTTNLKKGVYVVNGQKVVVK